LPFATWSVLDQLGEPAFQIFNDVLHALLFLSLHHPPSRFGEPQRRDLHLVLVRDDALGRRAREPRAHKLDHLRDGEAVRDHDRFRAAVARRGEQFERAAAIGLGEATGHWPPEPTPAPADLARPVRAERETNARWLWLDTRRNSPMHP